MYRPPATSPILDVEHALSIRYGERPYLSPNQRKLVHLTAEGRSVLAVMPTGSGKTLAVIGQALAYYSQVSLLVVPLLALADEMCERMLDAFVQNTSKLLRFDPELVHSYLQPGGAAYTAQLIIISVDHVTEHSDELMKLLTALPRLNRRLSRIFADEAHLFPTYDTFRLPFQIIGRTLQAIPVPLICMTATARPDMRAAIKHIFYGDRQSTVEEIVEACHRENISYRVERTSARGEQAIAEFCTLVVRTLKDNIWRGCHVLVYARTCDMCVRLSAAVRKELDRALPAMETIIEVYTSKTDDRKRVLESVKSTPKQARFLLFGTEAIGCGLDLHNVGVVLHYGITCSVENYQQQGGRAARPGCELPNGGHGLSLIFHVQEEWDALAFLLQPNTAAAISARQKGLQSPLQQAQLMLDYVNLGPEQCRRSWLAPEAKSCSALEADRGGMVLDWSRCDLCSRTLQSHQAAQEAASHAGEVGQLNQRLDTVLPLAEGKFLDGICFYCSVQLGKLTKYKQSPCNHHGFAWHSRCFQCWQGTHQGKQCQVMPNHTGSTASAKSRCYKCLRKLSNGANCLCHRVPYTLFLAGLCLDAVQHVCKGNGSNFARGVEIWKKLQKELPKSLIDAQLASYRDPRAPNQQQKDNAGEKLFCELFTSAGDTDFLWAHVVLVVVADTIKL
jgi:superfamily II DNA helicase RecQ